MHTAVDRRLLKAAAKFASPEELSEAVNGQLSPAQAIDRVKVLLSSSDVYSEVEQRRLLLLQMADFVAYLKEQAHSDNPQAWAALNRGFKLLSDQLERSNINIDDISTKLGKAHARFYMEGFMQGFTEIINVLNEKNIIELDAEEMKQLAHTGVERGMDYIESVTVSEDDE